MSNTTMSYLPERIVSLQPSATVILAALCELDRLVACTKYCADVCPEVRGTRTIVADSWTANSAEILGVGPDLVIAAVPYQEKSVSEILKGGVRFLGLAPRNLKDIYIDIAIIAGIVGANDTGQQLISDMQTQIESASAQTCQLSRPKVFCEEWGKPIIASQPWVAELVQAVGGEFVGEAGRQHSAEAVLAENPDVLVAAWCGAGDRVPLEKIVHDRGWDEMKAVRDSRVYCISDELLNTPAPTLLKGLKALASAIHPELIAEPAALGHGQAHAGRLRQISNAAANPRQQLRR